MTKEGQWDKQWQTEVWDHLADDWKQCRDLWPESMTEEQRSVCVNLTNKNLAQHGRCGGVAINLARLDMGRVSILGDVLSFTKAVVSGKHYFWNEQKKGSTVP